MALNDPDRKKMSKSKGTRDEHGSDAAGRYSSGLGTDVAVP